MRVDEISIWRQSFFEELESAFLYDCIARCENHSGRQNLFLRLGQESREQANVWKKKLIDSGIRAEDLVHHPSVRARFVTVLIRRLGPRAILPALAAMKVRGLSVFQDGEVSHSDVGEKLRHRAIRTGGNLRATVFGMNDGLISNISLILGMAGATENSQVLVTAGVAGLLAGAFSMAAGEYISVRSMRELYEHQMALEKAELKEFPQEEAEELAMIYEAKGMEKEEARRVAQRLIADPVRALDTLAREELGINPQDLGSPMGAAISSFLAFAVGAIIPVIPFFVFEQAMLISTIFAGFGLFCLGVGTSLFSGRNALWGGLRMLLIGSAAGAITFGVGKLFGLSVG